MSTIYLSLGSNKDNPRQQLKTALTSLVQHHAIEINAVSSLYRSPFIGAANQADVYNIVVAITTTLSPQVLLEACQQIEKGQHRTRGATLSARTIDIDILLFDDLIVNEKNLIIPHPQLTKRAFVLIPLAEITPDLQLPNGDMIKDFVDDEIKKTLKVIGTFQ